METNDVLELTVAGRPYRLGRPGLEVQLEAAERVRADRDRRFEEVLDRCSRLQGEPLHAALRLTFEHCLRVVTDRDVADWLDSPAGGVFLLWSAARKGRAEIAEEEARALHQQLDANQLIAVARFLAGGPMSLAADTRDDASRIVSVAQTACSEGAK